MAASAKCARRWLGSHRLLPQSKLMIMSKLEEREREKKRLLVEGRLRADRVGLANLNKDMRSLLQEHRAARLN